VKIFVYECGLREGAQAKGVAYSVEDKLKILKKLANAI
jgi:isopropylmalate/homocitrate/citramalate synthase